MSLQNKTFNELLTFARATGGGRFNASGQYEWLAAGEPRFDFDPVTLEPRGILVEEQRTNLFTQSQDFSNAAWGKGKGAVVEEGIAAWSGKPQYRLTATEAGAFAGRIERAVGVSSASYSCGFFIKRGTANWACITVEMTAVGKGRRVWFDLVSGAVGPNTAAGLSPNQWTWRAGIQKVSESEFFCWVSVDVTESGSLNSVIIAPDSNLSSTVSVGNSIFISGAQLEVGSFPTSYIPTTTAQVTRAADVCSVDNLSPWYRSDQGTLMVDWNLPVNTSDNNQLAAFGSAVASSMAIRMGVNNGRRVRAFAQDSAGVFQYAVDGPVEASRTTGKSAFSYKSKDDFAVSSAGSIHKDVSGDISDISISTLWVGRNGGNYANGHIRRIRYIPRRISDTELQALTAI